MTDSQADAEKGDHGAGDPGRPERPRLRTRPLGYKRSDVDEALEARDAQLTELRQDVAALWLAFSQHDRMIRALGGEDPQPRPAPAPAPASTDPGDADDGSEDLDTGAVAAEAESIGNQLSELDEVLAAIEMATKTLESTYADDIAHPAVDQDSEPDREPAAEGDGEARAEGDAPGRP